MLLRLALVTVLACICGCGADDWSQPHRPVAVGTLGPGFIDPAKPPAPEATITPRAGSWDGVHPAKGYRVVLLRSGTDTPTQTLVSAVEDWAQQEHVSLKTLAANRPGDYIPRIVEAMSLKPDLIVSAGNGLVDPLTVVSASHLDREFLVLGAELAEPTENVTAASWNGATFRGEGLDARTAYDPSSFTAERAARAVRAGVAAVLHGITGIVIRLS